MSIHLILSWVIVLLNSSKLFSDPVRRFFIALPGISTLIPLIPAVWNVDPSLILLNGDMIYKIFFIYLLTTVLHCGIFSLQTTTLWYNFFCRKDFSIMVWHVVSTEPLIKLLRLRSGMTQSQFSDFLSIPLKTIQSWEQSQRTAPYYVVNLVEFKLSVSFPDIDFSDYYIVKE